MIRAFQWDLGRQTERLDWLLAQLPRYADWGYQELYLHLEDAVEYPSLPGVARADAYSRRDFSRLVEAAGRAGIGVVPIVNLLGHTQYLIKVPELRDLNELRGPGGEALPEGQVCPLHPRMLEVADALLGDMAPFCTAGKVHVGLDESFSLGRHPLSSAEIARIGLGRHFAGHVQRLHGLAGARGLRLGLWADMLALLPEAIPHLPRGIIAYDWYYYPFTRHPRVELRNFAECDLAPALAAQGIEYWGCPMNGSFRHEPMPVFGERLANIRDWWRRCEDTKAGGFLVTSWEPNRLAIELTTAVDAAAACLWLDPGVDGDAEMLARGLERTFGGRQSELARAALAADARAFAGYARWEINEHWDSCATRQGVARYRAELAFFRRFARRKGLPRAFKASIGFRSYLAERDVFVRSAASQILSLRRRLAARGPGDPRIAAGLGALASRAGDFRETLSEGLRSARELWALTRDPGVQGPNERVLLQDRKRVFELIDWIAQVRKAPARLAERSPVCGRWQLILDIRLDRPALQRLVLERKDAQGRWTEVRARTTIEFRAAAARPRAAIRREWSVPVDGRESLYRISVRGIGQVTVCGVELTDGVSRLRPSGWQASRRVTLGKPAPAKGFPKLDWRMNSGSVTLRFQ